jgi:two-component sensor histidine kinase
MAVSEHVMVERDAETLRRTLDDEASWRRESEHRTKNTLQLISSILLLQSRREADESARAALRAALQRVTAVSVAHRHVVRTEAGEQVELAALVRELATELATSAQDGVAVELDLEPVFAPAPQGGPLALWLNEALANALRHGFRDGRAGRVLVSLRRDGDGFELAVEDNGVGASGDAAGGFGATLITLLAQQLRGRLERQPAQPGLRLSVHVPMDEPRP